MKILITGAAGFIGYHLGAYLSKQGHSVHGVDAFRDYYSISLKEHRRERLLRECGVAVSNLDLVDQSQVDDLLRKLRPEIVVHLAAQPGVRLPLGEYSNYTRDNLSAFSNIAILSKKHEVTNFLYASSSSVYGDSSAKILKENQEGLEPISYYGSTKLCNELIARNIFTDSLTKAIGLRFFTVYGEFGRPDMAYFRIAHSLLRGTTFQMYGDGEVKRDFTYVDDVVDSISKLLSWGIESQQSVNEIINIGGGNPYSLREMIEISENLIGTRLSIAQLPAVHGDVLRTFASTEKLESLIRYIPSTELSVGLERFYNWACSEEYNDQFMNEWQKS